MSGEARFAGLAQILFLAEAAHAMAGSDWPQERSSRSRSAPFSVQCRRRSPIAARTSRPKAAGSGTLLRRSISSYSIVS